MVEPPIGYGFPSPAGTLLAPGLGVFRDLAAGWVSSGHKADRRLDQGRTRIRRIGPTPRRLSTGPRWLERLDVAGVVTNTLWNGVRESRYELGAWVLIPSHVHIALRPLGDQDLASTVQSIKGSSAHAANRLLHGSGSRFWARSRQNAARRSRVYHYVIRYIENNPVKAGPCGSAQDWPWSNAGKNAAWKPRVPDPTAPATPTLGFLLLAGLSSCTPG